MALDNLNCRIGGIALFATQAKIAYGAVTKFKRKLSKSAFVLGKQM